MNIHPAYEKTLSDLNIPLIMEGFLEKENDLVLLSSSWDELTLSVLIDPMSHIIKKALYRDGNSIHLKILMELFCKEIIDLPLQEAAEHTCINLEYKLRDHSLYRPVPGIITPENADPIFEYPLKLIRKVFKSYCEEYTYTPPINFFDRQLSEGWLSLSGSNRIKRARDLLKKFLSELQIEDQLEVFEIEKDVKLIIRAVNRSDKADVSKLLMDFEKILKKELEENLYVEFEEVKDLNSLRRIS
tara:strand:- start:502 stop:1233 length:732 start_codon:yes stop_codon:yes gene_type:complete